MGLKRNFFYHIFKNNVAFNTTLLYNPPPPLENLRAVFHVELLPLPPPPLLPLPFCPLVIRIISITRIQTELLLKPSTERQHQRRRKGNNVQRSDHTAAVLFRRPLLCGAVAGLRGSAQRG